MSWQAAVLQLGTGEGAYCVRKCLVTCRLEILHSFQTPFWIERQY